MKENFMNEIDPKKMNELISKASKELNKTPTEIKEMLEGNQVQKIVNNLSDFEKKKIMQVLNDEKKIKEILSSQRAQNMLRKLSKGKQENNG